MEANARIDQLQDGGYIEDGDYFVFRSTARGVTYKIKASSILTPVQDGSNFQWTSLEEFDENEVCTYGGSWWQSQQDNNIGHVPGTEGDAWWIEIPKSSGFTWWKAGVYTDYRSPVLNVLNGSVRWFFLSAGVTLPFTSVDFEAELEDNKWIPVTDVTSGGTLVPGVAPNTLEADFQYGFDRMFYNVFDAITDDTEIIFINDRYATRMSMVVNMNTVGKKLKFPASFKMSDAQWDSGTQEYAIDPDQLGFVLFEAVGYGSVWFMKATTKFQ